MPEITRLVRSSFYTAGLVGMACLPMAARAADPIRIGVIAEAQAIAGASIPRAAQLAADEINARGGVDGRRIEIVSYDDKSSSADAVRAFQRAVSEDKVNAVIASYISEVVLALEPWAARLKMPMITPGAASNEISANIKKNFSANRYTFHGYLTSSAQALAVCDAMKEMFSAGKVKTAVIFSEDAAWTRPLDAGYEACLPKIGVKVLDHVRFSPDTTDFTPIFNKIEGQRPDVMVTGISHVGVQPTVQWASKQVPVPMIGIASQATNATFWQDTNGSAEGVMFMMFAGPESAITPRTVPFANAYKAKFGAFPGYAGYTAYDDVYMIADAVKRAGSTEADKLVDALEKTDMDGTLGRIAFTGKDDEFPHTLKTGPGYITGLMLQWQSGRQVTIWPDKLKGGAMRFPSYIKLGAAPSRTPDAGRPALPGRHVLP